MHDRLRNNIFDGLDGLLEDLEQRVATLDSVEALRGCEEVLGGFVGAMDASVHWRRELFREFDFDDAATEEGVLVVHVVVCDAIVGNLLLIVVPIVIIVV